MLAIKPLDRVCVIFSLHLATEYFRLIDDDNICAALRMYFGMANLKCEPTGALSLGAILEDPDRFRDKKICVIVSGGNVDAEVYKKILG